MIASIVAVHGSASHGFSKQAQPVIELIAGHGVRGDAHGGTTVKHRSRVARDPTQPNLRQVHLLHDELLADLRHGGLPVQPGAMGENVTTRGIALLQLARGTRLRLGESAVIEITGLRNPCVQIESFMPGLLAAVLDRSADGSLVRKAGVMAVVLEGGLLKAGDPIAVVHQPAVHRPLQPV